MQMHDESRAVVPGRRRSGTSPFERLIHPYVAMTHFPIDTEHRAQADPTGSIELPPNGLTHKAIFGPCASHKKV